MKLVVADDHKGLRAFVGQTVPRTVCRFADRRELPREHWTEIASTNPLERVNREIKRRTDVVGVRRENSAPHCFLVRLTPERRGYHPARIRLVGAIMLETNDEWTVARRYMSLETLARVNDNPNVRLPAVAT